MSETPDKITEPQEWIDDLVKSFSPAANDIDCALQNMGLHIKALESELDDLKAKLAAANVRIAELEDSWFKEHTEKLEARLRQTEMFRQFKEATNEEA